MGTAASVPQVGELLLLRHGATVWSRSGQHTGRSDIPLTPEGERAAAAWAPLLSRLAPVLVLSSPLRRARRTARLAGLTVGATDDDLREWDYGPVEGRTTAEVREQHPGWDVWRDGVDLDGTGAGETLGEVGARCDRVLGRVAGPLVEGDVVLVSHGHLLRVLAARWLGLAAGAGSLLRLDPAGLARLGHERDRRVIAQWGLNPPT